MYLHLGNNVVVKDSYVIGIFDMDTSTMKKSTQKYLEKLQSQGLLLNVVPTALPKSIVILKFNNEEKAYLSPLATSTLYKRINKE